MISKRKLTPARLWYLCGFALTILLVKLFFENNHLQVAERFPIKAVQRFLHENEIVPSNKNQNYKKHKTHTPCTLFELKRGNESQRRDDKVQCKRVPPVPGSCDIADRLFHTSPPASCQHQKQVSICKLLVSFFDISNIPLVIEWHQCYYNCHRHCLLFSNHHRYQNYKYHHKKIIMHPDCFNVCG
jgi:hypothetical protein